MSDRPIRILTVDDHKVVRKGLEVFLDVFNDFILIGEATSAQEAIILCDETEPDVVLMDLMMPEISGIEAIEQIHETYPNIRIIALTSFADESLIRDALNAGATSYILKNTDINELANTIRLAHAGQSTLAPEAKRILIDPEGDRKSDNEHQLTKRELEILELIVSGASNRQIGEKLQISLSTVKFHVSAVLSKLHVSSRTEAATYAVQNKLVD